MMHVTSKLTDNTNYEYFPKEEQECHNSVLDCCPVYMQSTHTHTSYIHNYQSTTHVRIFLSINLTALQAPVQKSYP